MKNKRKAIQEHRKPGTVKEIKVCLGLTDYYRKFIPLFSDISRPLTNLTKII